jgi:heme-degrading monooxygenase HmoA
VGRWHPGRLGAIFPAQILFGKQDACGGAVGFRDDPDPFASASDCVAADNPKTVLLGEVVLLRIYGRHDAPIAFLVPGQERGGVLAGTREEGEWLGIYPEFPEIRSLEKPGKRRCGMFARLVTIGGRREQVDEFARIGTERALPQLKRLDGFEGSLVLANRRSGEIVAVTLWESEEAMRATEGADYWLRAFGAEVAGGEVTGLDRYESVSSEAWQSQP